MRRLFASLFTLASMTATLLTATPALAVMEDYPSVRLQGLDKSVGRTATFEAKVGSTIQYGPLFIKIHACRKAPPIEKPESAAFLQIWEVPPGEQKSEWVFSGWMFASSPALSAMDHPVYDIWVLDCLGKDQPNDEAKAAATDAKADQTNLPAAAMTDTPGTDEDIPTDSEAEPDDDAAPAQADPAAQTVPVETPPAQTMNSVVPVTVPDPAAQPVPMTPDASTQEVRPQDPTGAGFTAYDLMKQGGANAQQPAPEPAPEPYPTYMPPSPQERPPQ